MINILYVEDEQSLRESVSELLIDEGYTICAVSSGKEAIRLIKKNKFDLVISDIMLPDTDGYNVLKVLEKELSGDIPPFIFASGLNEIKNIRKGMELGADDYLPKPFSSVELLNAIKTRLKRRELLIEKYKFDQNKLNEGIDNPNETEGKNLFDYNDSFFVTSSRKSKIIFVKEIALIKSDKDYSIITIESGKTFHVKKTLKAWLSVLPEKHFLQIHRSTIINVNLILEIKRSENYGHTILLKGISDNLIISQRFSRKLKQKLKSF